MLFDSYAGRALAGEGYVQNYYAEQRRHKQAKPPDGAIARGPGIGTDGASAAEHRDQGSREQAGRIAAGMLYGLSRR